MVTAYLWRITVEKTNPFKPNSHLKGHPEDFHNSKFQPVVQKGKNGTVLDNFGVLLDNFGVLLDKFGTVWDKVGGINTPINRVFNAKNG